MTTFLIGAGLVLALALLVAIYRKLERLPARVWAIAKEERARDESRAVAALQEATAAKVGVAVNALRAYEEHVAEHYLQLVAAAEARARVAERRSSETMTALSAATELVRELRAVLDGLGKRSAAAEIPAPEPDQRETVEMQRPPASCAPESADDDEPEEEPTRVGTRPIAGTPSAPNGLRLAPISSRGDGQR